MRKERGKKRTKDTPRGGRAYERQREMGKEKEQKGAKNGMTRNLR